MEEHVIVDSSFSAIINAPPGQNRHSLVVLQPTGR
jgi:hypothetical protein